MENTATKFVLEVQSHLVAHMVAACHLVGVLVTSTGLASQIVGSVHRDGMDMTALLLQP